MDEPEEVRADESTEGTLATRLAVELDPRLAGVWAHLFGSDLSGEVVEQVGWLLRMAYVQGYEDGLGEASTRLLFRRLGVGARARPDMSGGRRT